MKRVEPFSIPNEIMSDRQWLKWVISKILPKTESSICRIGQYKFTDHRAFVIVEETQVVHRMSVSAIAQQLEYPTLENVSVTFEATLDPAMGKRRYYLSDHLLTRNILLRLNGTATLSIPAPTILKFQDNTIFISRIPTYISSFEAANLSNLPPRINHNQNALKSITSSFQRLDIFSQEGIAYSIRVANEGLERVKELQIRIGHLTANSTRQRVSLRYGVTWAGRFPSRT